MISIKQHEWDTTDPDERRERYREANRLAASAKFDLQRASILMDLIDDEHVVVAIKEADWAIRGWNEAVAGDHLAREPNTRDVDPWEPYGALREPGDVTRTKRIEAIRRLHGAPD